MVAMPSEIFFEEILDFLVTSPTPEDIIAFQPPEKLQQRLSTLLEYNRQGTITSEQKQELDEFLKLNHFMSRLRLRARKKTG